MRTPFAWTKTPLMPRPAVACRLTVMPMVVWVACIIVQCATPCHAAFTPVSGPLYRIEDKASGLMLWPCEWNGTTTPVVQTMHWRGANTSWSLTSAGGGYWEIHCRSPFFSNALKLACQASGDSVYAQSSPSADGKLWLLEDAGGGYVYFKNKLKNKVLTAPASGAWLTTLIVAANTGLERQKFWVDEVRVAPSHCIAVPAGYAVTAPKRLVLCSTNYAGTSISGALGATPVTFHYATARWGQYYYLHTDSVLARTAGTYTVSAPGFPTNRIIVTDDVYRATPNGLAGGIGITNILGGFFEWQRQPLPQSNMSQILLNATNTNYEVVGTTGDLHGGWKDATSWDLETYQNGAALRNLSYATEDNSDANASAALLAEVAWGADFFVRFQKPDGSFPIRAMAYDTTSYDQNPNGYIVVNSDCGGSARAVQGLAAAARVLRGHDEALASRAFQAATNGWAWIKNNLDNYITSPNIYPETWWWGDAENVLGAALELAVTAPEAAALQADAAAFFNEGQFNGNGAWVKKTGSYVRQTKGADAALGLARYYQALPATNGNRTNIAAQLRSYFETTVGGINLPFGTDAATFNSGFGQNGVYATRAYISLNLYRALGEGRMLTCARDTMNWLSGANPFGSSFIIGVGAPNVAPQFNRPRTGSIGEIMPGIVTQDNGATLSTFGGYDYAVGEGGVADTSFVPAYMALADVVTRTAPQPLVSSGATWKYNSSGADLGSTWQATNYNDSAWASGPSLLGFGDANGLLPATTVASNRQLTTYFRTSFVVPADKPATRVNVNILCDDGAVVYLNGAEIWRDTNLPAGTIAYNTPALTSRDGAAESVWQSSPVQPALLRSGTNWLAAEVHQDSTSGTDLSFDLELLYGTASRVYVCQTATNLVPVFNSITQALAACQPGDIIHVIGSNYSGESVTISADVVFEGDAFSVGSLAIASGASVSFTQSLSGGSLNVADGGTASFTQSLNCNSLVTGGGTVNVASGATVSFAQSVSCGTLSASGGMVMGDGHSVTSATVHVSGTLLVSGGGALVTTDLGVPGLITFTNATLVAPGVTEHGTFTISSTWGTLVAMPLAFLDGFEAYGYNTVLSSLGHRGWSASDSSVKVQGAVKNRGLNAVALPSGTVCSNLINSAAKKVWSDFHIQPVLGDEPRSTPTNTASFAGYVNADGYLAVATAGGHWVVCSNRLDGQLVTPMSSNAFTRITLCQDLSTSPPMFAVFLDGGLVAQGLSSPASNATYKSFAVNNDDQGLSAYLDDVAIQTPIPDNLMNGVWADLDHDGVPDALEIDRYGTTYKMHAWPTLVIIQ